VYKHSIELCNIVRYANHPKTEEQLLKQIVCDVIIQLLSKGKFKAIKGNVILCKTWSLDGVLV
jgi:hypothetical protein